MNNKTNCKLQPTEWFRIYLTGVLITMIYCSLSYEVRAAEPVKFYVSVNGNDYPFLYAIDGSLEYVRLRDGEVKSGWGDEPDAQINIVPQWRFFNQWNDVTEVNAKSSTIKIGPRERHALMNNGSWEQVAVKGMWGLFEANYLHTSPEKAARCEYQLTVTESGIYKICMMYFPNEKNASNAKITVNHAKGEDIVNWNFKKGDQYGFAVVLGEYYLDKDKPASVTISNTGADGYIVADGVGFIKVNN